MATKSKTSLNKSKIHDFKLANGIRVTATATNTFRAIQGQVTLVGGPCIETEDRVGISHLVEHMVFEGSVNFPDKDETRTYIEFLGGEFNGFTSYSRVGLTLSVPSDKLDFFCEYLSDICFNAIFKRENLRKEKSVVQDEIYRYESSPIQGFIKFIDKKRFIEGYRPYKIAGTRTQVGKYTREQVVDWYKKIFFPENLTISIVGDFEINDLKKQLNRTFGLAPSTGRKALKARHIKLSENGIHTYINKKHDTAIGIISLPGLNLQKATKEDLTIYALIRYLIANSQQSILYKELRTNLGLLYSISANHSSGISSPGVFEISFKTSPDKLSKVYEIIFEKLREIKKTGFSKELFELGINGGNNMLKMGYLSLQEMQDQIIPEVHKPSEQVLSFEDIMKLRRSINLEQVNKALKALFRDQKLNVITQVSTQKHKTTVNKTLKRVATLD